MQTQGIDDNPAPHEQSRIPRELQAIFIASNQGQEVHQPPQKSIAFKIFRPWSLWQRLSSPRRVPRRKSISTTEKVEALPRPPLLVSHEISPQTYLGSTVLARGYSNQQFHALDTAYYNEPTPFQRASFGEYFVGVVRGGNVSALHKCLVAGLCPNASNAHGETVLHLVCRASLKEGFRLLMSFGADVQVADNCGRTPLHEACWAHKPCFEIIEDILKVDKRMLFVTDSLGATPLAYVRRENWTPFTRFLMSQKDKLWPDRDVALLGHEQASELATAKPNTRPIDNDVPEYCLPSIAVIANLGNFDGPTRSTRSSSSKSTKSFEEGLTETTDSSDDSDFLDDAEHSFSTDFEHTENDHREDTNTEYDSDDDSDDDTSLVSFDSNEMSDILRSIGANTPVQWSK